MKKLIFMLLLSVLCVNAYAQNNATVAYNMRPYTGLLVAKVLDTLTNADTSYLYFSPSSAAYNLHITTTYTRITGTAGGTEIVFGSDDNTNWYALNNVVTGTSTTHYADTATFSSLTTTSTKDWFYQGTTAYKYKHYRVRLITSGTQTGSFTGITYYRKP